MGLAKKARSASATSSSLNASWLGAVPRISMIREVLYCRSASSSVTSSTSCSSSSSPPSQEAADPLRSARMTRRFTAVASSDTMCASMALMVAWVCLYWASYSIFSRKCTCASDKAPAAAWLRTAAACSSDSRRSSINRVYTNAFTLRRSATDAAMSLSACIRLYSARRVCSSYASCTRPHAWAHAPDTWPHRLTRAAMTGRELTSQLSQLAASI